MTSKPEFTRDLARQLRSNQTNPENRLWSRLRARQLEGLKFRRQHPIGPFVADFFCLEAKLVLELDGSQHADEVAHDERRSQYLRDAGYAVLRIWNHEIISNLDEVIQRIADTLEQSRQSKKQQR